MYTFFLGLSLILITYIVYLHVKAKKDKIQFAEFIAEKLQRLLMDPVELNVYTEENGEKSLVLNENLARNLIRYVKRTNQLLTTFGNTKWQSIPFEKEKKFEKDFSYLIWRAIKEKFIYERVTTLAGVDLYDPFLFWVKQLYFCQLFEKLNIDDVEELQICEHGDIVFRTSYKQYNLHHRKYFKCKTCKEPRDIIKVRS